MNRDPLVSQRVWQLGDTGNRRGCETREAGFVPCGMQQVTVSFQRLHCLYKLLSQKIMCGNLSGSSAAPLREPGRASQSPSSPHLCPGHLCPHPPRPPSLPQISPPQAGLGAILLAGCLQYPCCTSQMLTLSSQHLRGQYFDKEMPLREQVCHPRKHMQSPGQGGGGAHIHLPPPLVQHCPGRLLRPG